MIEYQESEQPENSESEVVQEVYCIHLDRHKQRGRSFLTFARSRLCSLSHDAKATKSDANLINTFKQCCSKQDEFFPPNIPLRELIFRILLASGNQPATIEQLFDKVQYQLRNSGNMRNVTMDKLIRIVENDNYYGIGPVKNE